MSKVVLFLVFLLLTYAKGCYLNNEEIICREAQKRIGTVHIEKASIYLIKLDIIKFGYV